MVFSGRCHLFGASLLVFVRIFTCVVMLYMLAAGPSFWVGSQVVREGGRVVGCQPAFCIPWPCSCCTGSAERADWGLQKESLAAASGDQRPPANLSGPSVCRPTRSRSASLPLLLRSPPPAVLAVAGRAGLLASLDLLALQLACCSVAPFDAGRPMRSHFLLLSRLSSCPVCNTAGPN